MNSYLFLIYIYGEIDREVFVLCYKTKKPFITYYNIFQINRTWRKFKIFEITNTREYKFCYIKNKYKVFFSRRNIAM